MRDYLNVSVSSEVYSAIRQESYRTGCAMRDIAGEVLADAWLAAEKKAARGRTRILQGAMPETVWSGAHDQPMHCFGFVRSGLWAELESPHLEMMCPAGPSAYSYVKDARVSRLYLTEDGELTYGRALFSWDTGGNSVSAWPVADGGLGIISATDFLPLEMFLMVQQPQDVVSITHAELELLYNILAKIPCSDIRSVWPEEPVPGWIVRTQPRVDGMPRFIVKTQIPCLNGEEAAEAKRTELIERTKNLAKVGIVINVQPLPNGVCGILQLDTTKWRLPEPDRNQSEESQ